MAVIPKTKLTKKESSPLVIRRYSLPVLMFVAMITDDNLDNLDTVIEEYQKNNPLPKTIQAIRNWTGALNERLQFFYSKSEGVAVIVQADKMTVSSLAGDFMNHGQCRLELFLLLNFMTNV
jgi:hypothetical protein